MKNFVTDCNTYDEFMSKYYDENKMIKITGPFESDADREQLYKEEKEHFERNCETFISAGCSKIGEEIWFKKPI